MPAKNVVKEYKANSFYHVYNRGAAKQKIYRDQEDYKTFLGYLKFYLTEFNLQGSTLQVKVAPSKVLNNHAATVKMHGYCLMPNHFHLIIYQEKVDSMNRFMRSLATKYAMYFNLKHKRVGTLFETTYKAVRVETEDQLIYLSKYVHRNPVKLLPAGLNLAGFKYSSYGNYLRLFEQKWVKTDEILSYFKEKSYQRFVEDEDENDLKVIKDISLDSLQG